MINKDMRTDKIGKILDEFEKWIRESDINLIDTLDVWEIRMIKEWIANMLKRDGTL